MTTVSKPRQKMADPSPSHPSSTHTHGPEDPTTTDPFDSLLNLEATYHAEGYALGASDGARAGRIEGRTFGLEKGFEKFAELGRLGGRAGVWGARLERHPPRDGERVGVSEGEREGGGVGLKGSERLRRQVARLRELSDPESLSTVNDEESVNAFDERLREARAKATLVGKMVGERDGDAASDALASGGEAGAAKVKGKGKPAGGSKEMEDFAGLPLAKKKQ